MGGSRVRAPAGLFRGPAGALVFALHVGALGACDRIVPDRGPETLELNGDTVQLEAGVQVVEVRVERRQEGGELDPRRVAARPGDVVRFTAGDGGMHALAFVADALTPEARAFLESTAQLRSPPLVAAGTQWIVTLAGAPVGEYPFICSTHGARGILVVAATAES